jgi:hypothetical protein
VVEPSIFVCALTTLFMGCEISSIPHKFSMKKRKELEVVPNDYQIMLPLMNKKKKTDNVPIS